MVMTEPHRETSTSTGTEEKWAEALQLPPKSPPGSTKSERTSSATPENRSWLRSLKARPKKQAVTEDGDNEKKKEDHVQPVGLVALFRFATKLELAMDGIGLLLSVAAGAAQPLMTLFFANITKAFTEFGRILQEISMGNTSGDIYAEREAAKRNLKHSAGMMALWITVIGT